MASVYSLGLSYDMWYGTSHSRAFLCYLYEALRHSFSDSVVYKNYLIIS